MDVFLGKKEKISLLCRVCLIENPEKSASLFEVQDSMSASEKVRLCTGVEMCYTDELPGIICAQCSEELEAANRFRVKCEYSDSLLRRFYVNGVLNDPVVEIEFSRDAPQDLVKREVIEPCESWIKRKEEEDKIVHYIPQKFSSENSSSKVTDASPKTPEKKLQLTKVCISVKKTSVESGNIDSGYIKSGSDDKTNDIKVEKEKKIKPYSCSICDKSLSSKSSLDRHTMCVHSEEKNQQRQNITGYGANRRFHCTECPYSTPRRQALKYHTRTHTGEKPYQCKTCDAKFSQPGSLIDHTRLHSDKTYYTCHECGKQFKHKQRYKSHTLVHSGVFNYTCAICNKGLKTKKTLERHTNRHLNIRNYSCDACGAAFVALTDLINHSRKHNVVKNFECDICQFRTKIKQTLQKHIMRHAGEKKFKCDLCQYSAFDRGALTTHTRKHTREKRYSCPVCDMKMIHSTSVNRHMMTSHGLKYTLNDYTDRRIVK